jgi:PAT family beta-lactamase induction signal transducer AmpG
LVGQPYIYKFLWAPLLDRYAFGRLGRRRGWTFAMQLGLAVGFFLMAWMDPVHVPGWLAITALVVAFLSATQDVAIDAYRTDVLSADERGLGAALVTIGYRVAMLVAGAGALLIAAHWGWRLMYSVMAGFMLLQLLVSYAAPVPASEAEGPLSWREAVVSPWREFLTRDYVWALLLLMVCYKLTDAFGLTLNTAFLLRGMHFSLSEVASVSKVVGLTGSLLGSLVGGYLLPSLGIYRSLWWFGLLQALSNLMFMWMAMVAKSMGLMAASVFFEYFCGGLSSVAFVALLMGLCHQRYSATQYALFSAVASVGRVFVGPLAGLMAEHWGWADFYLISCLIGLPVLPLLTWLRPCLSAFDYSRSCSALH